MSKFILDASALLALINAENGAEIVEQHLSGAVMSCVNISEVAAILTSHEVPSEKIKQAIGFLISDIVPFDETQAFYTAELKEKTKKYDLSLGDRACLSLATIKKLPILTADKIWAKLNLKLDIKFIR